MASMTLQYLADRLEIDDLLTRYATALDNKDWELWATCFTPDAFIDYTSSGGVKGHVPAVKQWLGEVMGLFPMTQHLVTNRAVMVTGDTATARSCLFNPMAVGDGSGGQMLFFEGGYYVDRLVRTPEGWRITERIEESTYTTHKHPIAAPFGS